MQATDLKAWKTIRQSVLSNDGAWFAYVLAPNEGAATLVVRATAQGGKEIIYPIGEAPAGGGRGGIGGDASATLAFSGDSHWLAYTIYPAPAATGAGRGGRGGGAARGGRGGAQAAAPSSDAAPPTPPRNKLGLINLATGEKKEFDGVRRFVFNGDKPTWIAMQSYAEPAAAGAARSDGTDLVLYKLAAGEAVNVGNVAEFAFDDSGEWLAYTIDAHDEIGNGVQLRNMRTDVVRGIDADRALYRHLAWADSTDALTVLRGRADSTAHDTLYSVLVWANARRPRPRSSSSIRRSTPISPRE